MECTVRRQAIEDADQPLPRWEIAWRLGRAIVLAIGVTVALWGKPFRPDPRFGYGHACALASSDPVRAERLFRSLVDDAGGDFPDAQLQLALRAMDRGDWDELDAICERLKWDQANSDLLLTFGAKAIPSDRPDLARRCLEELRQRDTPYAIAALQGLAMLYEQEHSPEEALQCLEEITRIVPDNPHFWRLLAEAFAIRQKSGASAAAYRQVLRLRPRRRDEPEIRQRLIAQLIEAGEAADARQELERLISSDDNLTPEVLRLVEQVDRLGAAQASSIGARP